MFKKQKALVSGVFVKKDGTIYTLNLQICKEAKYGFIIIETTCHQKVI
jgi:hypothetical protein